MLPVGARRAGRYPQPQCALAPTPPCMMSDLIADILKRETTTEYESELLAAYRGKTILVTGGAGSIGAEAVKQLAGLQPTRLIAIDHSEYYLFRLKCELQTSFPDIHFDFVLLNICDYNRMKFIFQTYRPNIVLHTAACKHVPMCEADPYTAIQVNIVGATHIVELCLSYAADRFILVSTDKAVNPANVMGCTKRLAELLTQELLSQAAWGARAGIVRFGNVINSRGSVMPLFAEQIAAGGPLTVTHPDVERYFMSVQEAVRLMLVAGTLGKQGEIFMLDMGKQIKIKHIAEQMLHLTGQEDLSIIYTGLRPGEKLSEELTFDNESLSPTRFHKIYMIEQTQDVKIKYLDKLAILCSHAHQMDNQRLKTEIYNLLHAL